MNDNVADLILERLRRMEDRLERIDTAVRESRDRLGHLEQSYASLSRRVDQIDDRLDRIERRLDLQDVG